MIRFLLLFVVLLLPALLVSAEIRGIVSDAKNGEPLTGATLTIIGTNHFAVSGLDGSYIIRNVGSGEYTLRVSYISYKTVEENIVIGNESRLDVNIPMYDDALDLSAVEVVATHAGDTDLSARLSERNADNVINVISSKSIELSPDLTVANVVQRVSGVSLERNSNGDGQHAIVRGMDKRYNYTLVNGIKIPSPDPRNRYVPLDIFPSDLLDRLEVTKSLTPDMEGDAIGGVLDMKMKDAPHRFILNVNIGTGYNQINLDRPYRNFDRRKTSMRSPRDIHGTEYRASIDDFDVENLDFQDHQPLPHQIYGLSIGNRLLNDRFGIIVAGSYQNTYRGANSLFFDTDVNREDNTPFYDKVRIRQFSAQQIRGGIHSKMDYSPNNNHKIDLYNAFISLTDTEIRMLVDTNLRIGRAQGPGTGRISERERARLRIQQIFNSTLQGNHYFARRQFNVSWSAVYSQATNNEPDFTEVVRTTGTSRNSAGEIVQEPIILDRDLTRRWTNNSDTDLAGYLNLRYNLPINFMDAQISAGTMYRSKERSNFYDQYLLRASPITQNWEGNIFDHSWNLFNTQGTPTDPLNYESFENIFAYYGMAKLNYGNIQLLGGLRAESTEFGWVTNAPQQVPGRVGSISYLDYLPSVHIRYSPVPNTNIRTSYFRSLSRPNFFEVIPYSINEDDYRERGNPFLQRTSADNLDLRIEYYPAVLDQIMIGFFHKTIEDPIESALFIDGQAIFLQPNNFGTATNRGVEIDFTKYVRQFGLRAFYTYTDSRITTTKIFRYRDEEGSLTSREEMQTRPLQGQSRHIGNISLLFKDQKRKVDAQLSLVYTGNRIISVSPYLDNDIWQRAFTQLDFSVEKGFGENFKVYVKVNNLLNTPMRADIHQPNTFNPQQVPYLDVTESVLVREDFYRMGVFAGVKYSL